MNAAASPRPGLEATGALRETLAAVRNLHGLLGSQLAGPRVLAEVTRELCECLPQLAARAAADLSRMEQALETSGALLPLGAALDGTSRELAEVLEGAPISRLSAKERLRLEARVGASLPTFTALLDHFELLSAVPTRPGIVLPVGELLTSRPTREATSEREVPVTGDVSRIVTPLAASFLTHALALLVTASGRRAPRLDLCFEGDTARITVRTTDELGSPSPSMNARLPERQMLDSTTAVLEAAWRAGGGTIIDVSSGTLGFPAQLLP